MVIRVDSGCAARDIRQNVDEPVADVKPPRLRIVAVGGKRRIADEVTKVRRHCQSGRQARSYSAIAGSRAACQQGAAGADEKSSPVYAKFSYVVAAAGNGKFAMQIWTASPMAPGTDPSRTVLDQRLAENVHDDTQLGTHQSESIAVGLSSGP